MRIEEFRRKEKGLKKAVTVDFTKQHRPQKVARAASAQGSRQLLPFPVPPILEFSFFCALFPSTWRRLSPDALFTRIWDTRKHPESATLSCLPWQYPGAPSPRNAYFFMANAKLPNRPGFALLLPRPSKTIHT